MEWDLVENNEALLNNKDYVIVGILKVKKSYTYLSSNVRFYLNS